MELNKRIEKLQQNLKQNEIDCALLIYSRDIFYYTGTARPSFLAVTPDDYFLYVRSGIEFVLDEIFIDPDRIKAERSVETIYKEFFSKIDCGTVGAQLDIMPAKQLFALQKIFPNSTFANVSDIILEQRKTKDDLEIDNLKKACKAVDAGHRAGLDKIKINVTELELSAAFENGIRLAGHEGAFFFRHPDFFMSQGPISSGSNLFRFSGVVYSVTGVGLSASVPAGPSRRKIQAGDPIVIDIPAMINGYHADQTRSYILGQASSEIKDLFSNLKEIADHLIKCIKPGLTGKEIYEMASAKSEQLNVSDNFLSFGQGKKSVLVGHGVGLEVNEPPLLSSYEKSKIHEGYVMAIEMHILKEKVGVLKLEDMIRVGKDKNEILNITPRKLFEV